MTRSPPALNTSPNAVVKSGSRSWTRNRSVPRRSSRSMARLRACYAAHAPVGCAVTPSRCHRKIVAGVTGKTSAHRRRLTSKGRTRSA